MSTHSIIAIKNFDGSYDSIYCHYNGQPTGGVGDALCTKYTSEHSAQLLIDFGDHSSIMVDGSEAYASRENESWDDIQPINHLTEAWLVNYAKRFGKHLYIFVNGKWLHKNV